MSALRHGTNDRSTLEKYQICSTSASFQPALLSSLRSTRTALLLPWYYPLPHGTRGQKLSVPFHQKQCSALLISLVIVLYPSNEARALASLFSGRYVWESVCGHLRTLIWQLTPDCIKLCSVR